MLGWPVPSAKVSPSWTTTPAWPTQLQAARRRRGGAGPGGRRAGRSRREPAAPERRTALRGCGVPFGRGCGRRVAHAGEPRRVAVIEEGPVGRAIVAAATTGRVGAPV